jgi:hypothetical protein
MSWKLKRVNNTKRYNLWDDGKGEDGKKQLLLEQASAEDVVCFYGNKMKEHGQEYMKLWISEVDKEYDKNC